MKTDQHFTTAVATKPVPFSDDEGGLQLGRLVDTMRRRTLLILSITAVVAGLAHLKALKDKPIYTGNFEILTKSVTAESEVISSVPQTLANRQQDTTTATTPTLDATKIRVLRSPSLLLPIIEKLKPTYPTINYTTISENLTIQTDDENILAVTYTNVDAKLVKDVLTGLSNAYLNYSLEERQKDIRQGITFVEDQLPQLGARVATQQKKLQQFRQAYNLIDPDMQAKQLSDQAGTLGQQQLETETQLEEARLLYGELSSELTSQPTESVATSALSQSPRYQKLLDQLLEIDSKLAENSALYLDNSFEMQVLRSQRQNLLPLIEREGARVQGEVVSQIRELENRREAISQSVGDLNQRTKILSTITREYTDIQRELQIATDNLNQFLAKREGLRIDIAQRQLPWQLLTPPGEPQQGPVNVRRTLTLGVILGLLLGVGAALLADKLTNSIHTAREVRAITKLPLLSVIPFSRQLERSDGPDRAIAWLQSAAEASLTNNHSLRQIDLPLLEAFRSLCANIRMISPDQPISSLVVSSATPSNGKTTTAIYLAQAAAAMGQRVLLVDADLRQPTLHKRLGVFNLIGLTDVVSADLDIFNAVQPMTWESNLFVMTAGTISPDPSRILSSQAMKSFIDKAHENFDLVIFDTPPLLGLADAYLFSSYTDGILLVVRLHQLKRSLLEKALEDLRVASTSVIGVVANASEDRMITSYSPYHSYVQNSKQSPFLSLFEQARRLIKNSNNRMG
jgi:polysaccharide biosynthesis transport protein